MGETRLSDSSSVEKIRIQICYATPQEQILLDLMVPRDTSIVEAIKLSQILARCPEMTLEQSKFGIFGKLKPTDTPLRNGDRVEIYRPLIADPMEARRRRAKKQAEKK